MKYLILIAGLAFAAIGCQTATAEEQTETPAPPSKYEPTDSSLATHPLPDWYQDGKLGIFVCWGLYSLPAWAKGPGKPLEEILAEGDGTEWFTNNPYAEWYLNSLKIDGSATAAHHAATYGEGFSYYDFVPQFNEASKNWQPDEMAELFKEVGAAYVVLVSKFHDGFILWPSEHPNPFRKDFIAERDIVGELSSAVKERGMEMGLYYSSGLDWTFNDKTIVNFPDLFTAIPQDTNYVKYIDAHWRELIDRYQPKILWADIGSPQAYDPRPLIADFYNQDEEGVVNNRHKMAMGADGFMSPVHHDFSTPEYQVLDTISDKKWETVRGIGLSFGYNQVEAADKLLSVDELVDMFIDIVSKNGNLLLNVGPKADGSISEGQLERLKGLGQWHQAHREAIYGSRPWKTAQAETQNGERVRFTQKDGQVYLFLLDQPTGKEIIIDGLPLESAQQIQAVSDATVSGLQFENGQLRFQATLNGEQPAYVFKIQP